MNTLKVTVTNELAESMGQYLARQQETQVVEVRHPMFSVTTVIEIETELSRGQIAEYIWNNPFMTDELINVQEA